MEGHRVERLFLESPPPPPPPRLILPFPKTENYFQVGAV